ncbi:MAG: hypothetical protein ACXAE3_08255 [Candidatus Kariarchaeaceae archaeon]
MVTVKDPKSIYLINWQNLPRSVRTLYRAQLLIILRYIEPTTTYHFREFSYSKNNVRKCFREFVLDDLVEENFQLYKLTQNGEQVVEELLKDSMMVDWYQGISELTFGKRPLVQRTD